MTARLLLVLAGIPLLALVPGAGETVAEAKQKVKGTWRAVSVEDRGFPMPPSDIEPLRVVIAGDKVVFKWATKDTNFSLRLDPSSDPKEIDLTCLDGPLTNRVCRGIYKFEVDRFSFCINTRGTEDRPKEYKTTVRNGYAIYELKREKP